jgi:putative hydrolase of the HAD superfamily
MIRLISFDVWNTLLDINLMLKALGKALAEIIETEEKDVFEKIMNARRQIKEQRKNKIGIPERALEESQELLAKILGVDVEIVKRAAAKAVLNVDSKIVLDDVKETLKSLKEQNYTIITLGNVMFWPSSYTRLILEKFDLADYIDKQFYSDELKAYKPMKEVFLKPLRYFKVSPSEAVHVGDTKAEDFEGALSSGLYAIWINPNAQTVEKIAEKGFVIRSLRDVLNVLDEM